jgi:hypothetical protein
LLRLDLPFAIFFLVCFAALPNALDVAACEPLPPLRFAAASAARVAMNRLAQARAATSADRYRRVKSDFPQLRRIASPPGARRAPRCYTQDLGGKAIIATVSRRLHLATPSSSSKSAPGRSGFVKEFEWAQLLQGT